MSNRENIECRVYKDPDWAIDEIEHLRAEYDALARWVEALVATANMKYNPNLRNSIAFYVGDNFLSQCPLSVDDTQKKVGG